MAKTSPSKIVVNITKSNKRACIFKRNKETEIGYHPYFRNYTQQIIESIHFETRKQHHIQQTQLCTLPSYLIYLFTFVDNQVNIFNQQAGKPAMAAIEQTSPNNNQITISKYTTKIDYPDTQVRDKVPATNKS